MDVAIKDLASSGALGAIVAAVFSLLALVIGVLVWALKRYVDTSIDREKDFSGFMRALTTSLNGLGINCQTCRTDSQAAIIDMETNVKAEIQHVVWASHDKAALETAAVVKAAFEKTDAVITGVATSIRTSNEALVQAVRTQILENRVEELSRPLNVGGDGVVRR
jgi:hypothetical protein